LAGSKDVHTTRDQDGRAAVIAVDQTSLAVGPTTNPGLLLVDTESGTTPRRNPFVLIMNFIAN
jgi:hypothetical protein